MNESTTNMRTEEAIKEKIKESRFESINGKDLMEMDLPPLHYTISTILPHAVYRQPLIDDLDIKVVQFF